MSISDSERGDLENFAAAVKVALARAEPRFRFGRFKVFIAALEPNVATRRLLVEAHRAGLLRLARADLTSAMAPDLVQESEVEYLNATWHLIDTEDK